MINNYIVYIPELLVKLEALETEAEKVEVIRAYVNAHPLQADGLRRFVGLAFHPAVKVELPEGIPPYKKGTDLYGKAYSNLFRELKNVEKRLITIGVNRIQKQLKREMYFIQILEGLHQQEAELLVQLKDRKFSSYPTLNVEIFQTAFPSWFIDWPIAIKEEVKENFTNAEEIG